jgi:hypothetical protein
VRFPVDIGTVPMRWSRRERRCVSGVESAGASLERTITEIAIMTEELNTLPKSSAAASDTIVDVDLSAEINAAMATEHGETVRCVRVYGDNYRCNWWKRREHPTTGKPMASGFDVSELRVKRSSFLKVRKTAEGLRIQDMTLPLSKNRASN